MDILNIMQCTHLGGMEQASLRLMRSLRARGHRCRVLSLNPLGALEELLAAEGIPADGLPYAGALGWRSVPALWRRLRKERADALLMTGHNLLAMLALGRLCEGRRLLAIHFHHAVRPAWQWRVFYRLAMARFSAISFPSDFIRFEAEAILPRAGASARTLRNPLEAPAPATPAARAEARLRLGLPARAAVVGNAGWLIERKRFDVFLRTAALIAAARPDVRFVIAGDGEERQRLEGLAAGLGIAERVHWLGWQAEMAPFYRALDLLLFNSDWDAMGNTPVEAMAHGVPVVASVRHGGLKEIVTDRRFGRLFAEHDPPRLAEAALEVLAGADPAMAEQGRRRAVTLSDPAAIAAEVEAILEGRALRPTASTAPPAPARPCARGSG